jgi:hypothetical protein
MSVSWLANAMLLLQHNMHDVYSRISVLLKPRTISKKG